LLEPAFFSGRTLYVIQPECTPVMSQTITYNTGGIPFQLSKYKYLSIKCWLMVLGWKM
jgi:hypothetical protein